MTDAAGAAGRAPVDERILARRRTVARARARRRRRVTATVVALVVAGLVTLAAVRSPLFAVGQVRVTGVTGAQAAAVADAADVAVGHSLVGVDLAATAARVRALPWVATVRVSREPPSTVAVDVVARTPVALVAGADATALVDAGGYVVALGPRGTTPTVAAAPVNVPTIDAPRTVLPAAGNRVSDAAVRNALSVAAALPAELKAAVVRYDAASPRGLRVRLRAAAAGDRRCGTGLGALRDRRAGTRQGRCPRRAARPARRATPRPSRRNRRPCPRQPGRRAGAAPAPWPAVRLTVPPPDYGRRKSRLT